MKTATELQKELDALQKEFDQYKRESVKWSVEDFLYEAENIGYTITKEQAQEALERMMRKHDCELGITWETVRCYIEEYGTAKPEKHDLNTPVKVMRIINNAFDQHFIGMTGTVVGYNEPDEDDTPIHIVEFDNGEKENFWYEELAIPTILNH